MKAYVGLGGNLGDVENNFKTALALLNSLPEVCLLEVSSFYRNPAISPIPQPDFLNGVCCFEWSKDPFSLFKALQQIQRILGQKPKPKEAPRLIDLDLLFFGKEEIQTLELEVPHPRWQERLFVLIPLAELTATIEVGGVIFDILQMREKLYAQSPC